MSETKSATASPALPSATPPSATLAQATVQPAVLPGGDRDAKGCTGSAGYTWSHLHEKCIRVFEDGVRLDPKHKSLDKSLSAFAVFLPGDESRVEVFFPGRAPVILARDGDKLAWRDGAYVLSRAKRLHTLSEVSGAKLYEGTSR